MVSPFSPDICVTPILACFLSVYQLCQPSFMFTLIRYQYDKEIAGMLVNLSWNETDQNMCDIL